MPVTTDNLFDKLAAYQPLGFRRSTRRSEASGGRRTSARSSNTSGRPAEGPRRSSNGHHAPLRLRAVGSCEAAYESGDAYVSVADIAEQEDIPYAFARSIQHDLVKGRAYQDGARRARRPGARTATRRTITLLEVLEAVQGPVSVSLCAVDAGVLRSARRRVLVQQAVDGRRQPAEQLFRFHHAARSSWSRVARAPRHQEGHRIAAPTVGAHVVPGGRVRWMRCLSPPSRRRSRRRGAQKHSRSCGVCGLARGRRHVSRRILPLRALRGAAALPRSAMARHR